MKRSVIKTLPITLAALALLGFTGCQKNKSTTPTGGVIEVTTTIEGLAADVAKSSNAISRAIVSDATWKSGNTYSMWVVPYIDASGTGSQGSLRLSGNYEDNVKYTYGTNFTADRVVYYPSEKSKVDLYAISPSITGAITSLTAQPFAILADQTTAANVTSSDLMTGLGSGDAATKAATVVFTHRQSKALVNVTIPATYKGQTVSSIKSVEVLGVQLKSTYKVADATAAPAIEGTLTTNPKTAIAAYQATVPAAGAVDGTYAYEAIVTPGTTIAAGASIVRVTLNVASLGEVVFNCRTSSAYTYEATKQTAITVSIGDQTEITISPVTITDWGKAADVAGQPAKLSKLIFDLSGTNTCTIVANAAKADLTIEGVSLVGTVKYTAGAGNVGQYVVEFDHGTNAGGNLESVAFKTASDGNIGGTGFSSLVGYQIKGDPTLDNYSTVIATITFTGDQAASIAKK